jgi:hypothetical protein
VDCERDWSFTKLTSSPLFLTHLLDASVRIHSTGQRGEDSITAAHSFHCSAIRIFSSSSHVSSAFVWLWSSHQHPRLIKTPGIRPSPHHLFVSRLSVNPAWLWARVGPPFFLSPSSDVTSDLPILRRIFSLVSNTIALSNSGRLTLN